MKIIRKTLAIATTIVAMAVTVPAAAIVIDFEGVTLTGGIGSNTAVQSYLDGVFGSGFVKVYGTVADRAYDGDGHANKDPSSGRRVTLGTTDGATSPTDYTHFHPGLDTFIRNVGTDGGTNTAWGSLGNDKFVFVFKSPIYFVSFDWEVFPDGTCGTCTGGPTSRTSNCGRARRCSEPPIHLRPWRSQFPGHHSQQLRAGNRAFQHYLLTGGDAP